MLEALAWLVPVGLGLVALLIATDRPVRIVVFALGLVLVPVGLVLVLSLHERNTTIATALDLPPRQLDES